MKSNVQPNFYFSAYPLKALNLPEAEKKSYLHIYTGKGSTVKNSGSIKVLPMKDVYNRPAETKAAAIKPTDSVEERDAEWFASYE